MLKHLLITIICLLILQFSIPAAAEFYEYVDAKGVKHFTDNVSTIPPQYHSQLERYHEIIMLPGENTDSDLLPADDDATGKNVNPLDEETLRNQQKILIWKKEALLKKFTTLQADREEIQNSKKNAKNRMQTVRYNERVRQLNEKIKQYKEQEKEFQTDLEKYNQAVNDLQARN